MASFINITEMFFGTAFNAGAYYPTVILVISKYTTDFQIYTFPTCWMKVQNRLGMTFWRNTALDLTLHFNIMLLIPV